MPNFDLDYASHGAGARIAYYVTDAPATGVPLIALCGGPGSDHRYLRVGGAFDIIGLERRLVFVDQRGSGRSSDDEPETTIDQIVGDVEAVRQTLGAPQIDLFGHSFGSYLAMAYAKKHPDKARGLVLASSPPPRFGDTPQLFDLIYPDRVDAWRDLRAGLDSVVPTRVMDPLHAMEFAHQRAHDLYVKSVVDHRTNFRVNNRLRKQMEGLDHTAALRALAAPTLVLHGRWDTIVAVAAGWAVHRLVPGSRFRVFEESGHLPFVEEPVAYADAVTEFLAEIDARSAVGAAAS